MMLQSCCNEHGVQRVIRTHFAEDGTNVSDETPSDGGDASSASTSPITIVATAAGRTTSRPFQNRTFNLFPVSTFEEHTVHCWSMGHERELLGAPGARPQCRVLRWIGSLNMI
jgi:hypothetical protein